MTPPAQRTGAARGSAARAAARAAAAAEAGAGEAGATGKPNVAPTAAGPSAAGKRKPPKGAAPKREAAKGAALKGAASKAIGKATKGSAPTGAALKANAAKGAATKRAATVQAEESDGEGGLELYFLRHADAGDPAEWQGEDADRPLSKKGRRQARRLGKSLAELKFRPDALITSPKLRAADSARIVGRALGVKPETDQRLAGALGDSDLRAVLTGLPGAARRVVLVGHDPEFSTLVSWLVGAPLSLRKGALARTDLPNRTVAAGAASLRWLLPPDAVPD